VRFRGLTITKEVFEKKYEVKLTDLQWQILTKSCEKDWETNAIEELRKLAFKSMRKSMSDIGYKMDLSKAEIVFKKIE
tara:strand:- start:486 stop:719 length:234 start_codon:yes stop_codon:yes gene_type:complete